MPVFIAIGCNVRENGYSFNSFRRKRQRIKPYEIKEIRKAVEYAVAKKWRVTDAGRSSHAWARLKCPESSREGCIISVWSTPRVPQRHARQIIRAVDKCPHS